MLLSFNISVRFGYQDYMRVGKCSFFFIIIPCDFKKIQVFLP